MYGNLHALPPLATRAVGLNSAGTLLAFAFSGFSFAFSFPSFFTRPPPTFFEASFSAAAAALAVPITSPSAGHCIITSFFRLVWLRMARGHFPPPLEDRDVLLLFQALLVTDRTSASRIGLMLGGDGHPCAADDRSVREDVLSSEVVIFFQRHLLVKAQLRADVDNEKVSQDEVLILDHGATEGPGAAAQGVDAGEVGGLRLVGRKRLSCPQLGQQKAGGCHRRDDVASRGRVRGVDGVVGAILGLGAVVVLPTTDVVADLHASFAEPRSVDEALVPGRAQLPSHHSLQAELLVLLQARFVDVPRRFYGGGLEQGLHLGDALQALRRLRAPRRDNAEMELISLRQPLALGRRQDLEELLLVRALALELGEPALAVEAVLDAERAAKEFLHRIPVIEDPATRRDPNRVRATLAWTAAADGVGHLDPLAPIIRKPRHPGEVYRDRLAWDGFPLGRLGFRLHQRVPGALGYRHLLGCDRDLLALAGNLGTALELLLPPHLHHHGIPHVATAELALAFRDVGELLHHRADGLPQGAWSCFAQG
mmetsp:Transcript_93836/g.247831  ORF Transcript_93836/g.247831 Transcript_93836/m.247831 type:complete len:539 (+) Transcript_93836:201-1817(+)